MKIFNKILWGIKPPENKSDIWFDGDVFKIYRKGDWEAVTIEIDAASKLTDVIKNINDVYQTKLTEGDGILLEDSKISVRRMFQVVSKLPNKGDYNTIYLLVENNKEIGSYTYINDSWKEITSTIFIDDILSLSSENAVQNKVITEELNNKVDKVSGKQLSTEDFTTELKTKLEGMKSFDTTEISNKLNGLQIQIDTLVRGDISTAIESFNEITNFLKGIEDAESLESIIADIEQKITNKQDTIADLDIIRSGASLGATALQTVPKGYATETWVSTEIAKAQLEGEGVDPSGFATKDDIKGLATKEETEAVKTWVNEQGFLTEHQDITGKQDVIDDLEAIREGAAKGATALQSYTEKYKGTVTGIKVNGSTHNPSNGVVDLGTISADGSLRIHFEPNFDLEIGQHIDVTSLVQQSMGITPAELYEEVVTNKKKTALFIHELMGGELQEISRVIDSLYEGVGLSYLSTLEGLPSPFQLIISTTQCQLVIVDMLAGYNSVVVPLTEMVEGKQEQLVSGTNIKTINGESILGSGNIEISYDDPELKVVNHESSDTNVELTPYVTHKWGTISSLTLTFSENTESEYNVVFEANDADFVLSIPQNIRWANSQIPQFEAQKQYEISIKGERALYAVFDAPYTEET